MVKRACRFFALGTCTRGEACAYSHEVTSSSGPRSGPNLSVHTPSFTTLPTSPAKVTGIPCRFHLLGRCNKGVDCPYEHLNEDIPTSNSKQNAQLESLHVPSEPIHIQGTKMENNPLIPPERSTREIEVRNLRGASVIFGPGAYVQELEFPSDYSAVQMISPQPDRDKTSFYCCHCQNQGRWICTKTETESRH